MKYEIFGISFDHELTDINRDFNEEVFDAEESATYISKDKYHFDDGTLSFDYYYGIEAIYDWDNRFSYSVSLIPCVDSLNDDLKAEIAEFSGLSVDEINEFDSLAYGGCIVLASDTIRGDKVDRNTLNIVASVIPTINGMLGFYLDRRATSMNKSGWELIRDFVCTQQI